MQIHKGIKIIDLVLFVKNTLILCDFHIGYEEALNKQGVLIPRFQFKDTIARLDRIFDQINKKRKAGGKKDKEKNKIKTIIINGDIKHEFGRISEQEWREALKLIDYLQKKCEKLILIKGNHDTILGPIAKKRKIEIVDDYLINNILIIHGHKLPKTLSKCKAKTIIIGHEHPAIGLREGTKVERFKCYLKGKFKNHILIVQPSFITVTGGTDVTKEKLLSPFLNKLPKKELNKFECWVVADKIRYFWEVGEL